jgi:hypothetical protein
MCLLELQGHVDLHTVMRHQELNRISDATCNITFM